MRPQPSELPSMNNSREDMVKRLPIDDAAENPRWMIDRLLEDLSPADQALLAGVWSGEPEHAERCADG